MQVCYLGGQAKSTIIEINPKHLRDDELLFIETSLEKTGYRTEVGPIIYTDSLLENLNKEPPCKYENLYSICNAASLQEFDMIWFKDKTARLNHVPWYGEADAFE